MKIIRAMLVILVLGAVIVLLPGCKAKTEETAAATQTAKVIKGNLTQQISAAGNLALSKTDDLVVDLFYPTGTKGTIGEVLVEEGETVTKGQVLVTIDKSEWDDQLATLESLVTTKERALLTSQISLKTAEQNLKTSKDTYNSAITTKETAVFSAEISLQQAEISLSSSINEVDYNSAVAALNKARTWYKYITTGYKTADPVEFILVTEQAKETLDTAQATFDNIIGGYDSNAVNLKKDQLKSAQMALANAQNDLAAAKANTADMALKEMSLTLSQGNLQDAEKALADAKTDVANAKSKSPDIVAPYDGFITSVNVAGGDEVLNGTVVATIADPDKFEADILVSEVDITDVSLNQMATVTLDAIPTAFLTARVTHISPTATISSGVVNYTVKVTIDEPGTNPLAAFGPPTGSANATASGGFPKGSFTPPSGTSDSSKFPAFSGNQTFGGFPAVNTASVQLRQGLTATVTITIASRTDALMVPNTAITTEGQNSYVQVVKTTGELEKRQVTTGISNWMYTEITDGLTEGETIQVPLNTAPSSDFPQGGFFMGR